MSLAAGRYPELHKQEEKKAHVSATLRMSAEYRVAE